MREAQGAGVEPWNTAEHDKAVHKPAPEGGTTNSMESEPPVSEACDDEGDESAPADDDMTFIELPDVAAEGEAEGGGSQSQYRQQSQESESEGSQSSQGSHCTARSPRRGRHNRRAAQQFMRWTD